MYINTVLIYEGSTHVAGAHWGSVSTFFTIDRSSLKDLFISSFTKVQLNLYPYTRSICQLLSMMSCSSLSYKITIIK